MTEETVCINSYEIDVRRSDIRRDSKLTNQIQATISQFEATNPDQNALVQNKKCGGLTRHVPWETDTPMRSNKARALLDGHKICYWILFSSAVVQRCVSFWKHNLPPGRRHFIPRRP